jgi:GNAT superfamily N-acetyltransferase
MQTRLATAADKDQILALFDAFSAMLHVADTPSQIGGPILDEILKRPDTQVFVAEEGGRLLGLVTFYLLPNVRHGFDRGHIEDFFVLASARRRGVATALFRAVTEYCGTHGITVIKLDSGNDLTSAHAFYESVGGRSTERFFRFDLG